jgi:hypothetical protein
MTTIEDRLVELLTAAHKMNLPLPENINLAGDKIQLRFASVIGLRMWADMCHTETTTVQSVEAPERVLEAFAGTARGVELEAIALQRHLSAVSL